VSGEVEPAKWTWEPSSASACLDWALYSTYDVINGELINRVGEGMGGKRERNEGAAAPVQSVGYLSASLPPGSHLLPYPISERTETAQASPVLHQAHQIITRIIHTSVPTTSPCPLARRTTAGRNQQTMAHHVSSFPQKPNSRSEPRYLPVPRRTSPS
jgi:hypothetical protein